MSKITLKDFSPDNIPTQKQVDDLGQFLLENFENEIGGNKEANGEGAIEMAVRLLLNLKTQRTRNQNLSQFLSAVVWDLNNKDKEGRPATKMNIPNAVYEVVGKKLAQLPSDRKITESEALELARKK